MKNSAFALFLVAGSGHRPFRGDLNHSSQKRHTFRCLLSSSGEWIRYHPSMGTTDHVKNEDPVSQVFSSGEWIRTTDLRVMSQNPESVPFVRRALQISRPDELWSTLAGHAAVANRYSYSICFTWVRQVLFLAFLHSS